MTDASIAEFISFCLSAFGIGLSSSYLLRVFIRAGKYISQ